MCLALPYRITSLPGPGRALAEGPDGTRDIAIDLLEGLRPGDYVLVAYGSAIRQVESDEAAEILEVFQALQEPDPPPVR
jgi:hydrogenase assembly chaperone HypC/HupF